MSMLHTECSLAIPMYLIAKLAQPHTHHILHTPHTFVYVQQKTPRLIYHSHWSAQCGEVDVCEHTDRRKSIDRQ